MQQMAAPRKIDRYAYRAIADAGQNEQGVADVAPTIVAVGQAWSPSALR